MARSSDSALALGYAAGFGDDPPKAVANKGALILGALAWGARCGIPLGDALATLVNRRFEPNPLTANLLGKERSWRNTISLAAADLDAGVPLSEALFRVERFLPPYVIPAVREAERRGRLAESLEALSRQVSRRVIVFGRRVSALVFPLTVLGISVMFGVITLERLGRFSAEFGMSNFRDAALTAFLAFRFMPLVFLLFFPSIFVLRFLFKREPFFRAFVESFALLIPFVGRDLKRIAILDAVSAMSGVVASGGGLAEAAEIAAESSSSHWMRCRLERFASSVERGSDWATAWEDMRLGFPFLDWLVRNAAVREDPLEAFYSIAGFLRGEISHFTILFARGVEVAATLLNAVFAGTIVLSMMLFLYKIVMAQMDTLW